MAEGVSIVTNAEKRKKVEDLYAKVRKKRVELTIKTSGSDDYSVYQGIHGDNAECMTPPPSPWASTTPPAPPPITGRLQAASLSVLVPGNSQHVRRHSADPNLPEIINENRVFTGSTHSSLALSCKDTEEPDYEKIYNEDNSGDSCYEKIKEDVEGGVQGVAAEGGYSVSKGWSDTHTKMQPGLSFVGYETVKDPNEDEDSLDPNYECVAQGGSSETDFGYEPVRVSRNFEDSDSNSDGYERVRNKAEDTAEPGYATVQRSDSDTDPRYEVVHQRSFNSRYAGNRATELGTPRSVARNPNSTILFVPGDSSMRVSNASSDQDESSGSNEPSATFL